MTASIPTNVSAVRNRRINLVLTVGLVVCLVLLVKDYRWSVVWNSSPLLLTGLWYSWVLTLVSVAIGLPCGILLALGRRSRFHVLRWLAGAYVEVLRATPQLMVIFWIYFAIPALFGTRIPSWPAAILSLSMMAAAYLAEVVRGGLKSVPTVLIETGYSSGLNRNDILRFIVIPQALRTMIPAIIAHVVMMFKITSLIYIVGITDFFRAVILVNNRVYEPIPLYLTLAAGYFICCYALSRLVRLFDRRHGTTT
jgi:His/Glu/Gln/Arg/opine family amino acid ABC transporter permease subunit